MAQLINIEVVFALPTEQTNIHLALPADSTIRQAISAAKLFAGEIDNLQVGIFGKLRSLDFPLSGGDRVEIYRPLIIDPKDARVARVKRDRKAKLQKRQKKAAD